MKSLILVLAIAVVIAAIAGCAQKEKNIAFAAVVDEVDDGSLLVTTVDFDDFEKALVGFSKELKPDFDITVGRRVLIVILPEVRESYPVQVTAVSISPLEDEAGGDPQYQKISAAKAKGMMDEGGIVVLDVRTKSEFTQSHISGAVLIPDYDIGSLAPEALPDKEQIILVYCRSGRRSEAAARVLVEMGYVNIYDFGGIIDWPYETVNGK